MQLKLYYPVKPFSVNQRFGGNYDLYKQFNIKGHNGLDLMAPHGTPIYAAHDGVCYTEIDSNQGHGVVIRTNEPIEFNGEKVYFKTIYWHMIDSDAVVKTGQRVRAGQLIGYADSTGFSTGSHLHFGLKPQAWKEKNWTWYNTEQDNGYAGAIDPMPFFNGFYAQDIKPPTASDEIAVLAAKKQAAGDKGAATLWALAKVLKAFGY